MRSTPAHYLSDEAQQPSFIDVSGIDDLHSMSPLKIPEILAKVSHFSFKNGRCKAPEILIMCGLMRLWSEILVT